MNSGTYVAIPTPFRQGAVDVDSLRRVIRHVLSGGVDGLVACGTTGESPTLSVEEWSLVVATAVEEAGARPVIAGTGSNNTQATVERTALAARLGAKAALVVVPYYNKPGQEGMFQHFQQVARSGGLPVILYNIPGRTSRNMEPETVLRLAKIPGIVGIKEASGSLDAVSAIVAGAPADFRVYSGDDSLTLPMVSLGGAGVIATTGNIAPQGMSEIYGAYASGDVAAARAAHYRLLPLFQTLFVESNPAPLKYVLHRMGLVENELRLPLVPVSDSTARRLDAAMEACGIARVQP